MRTLAFIAFLFLMASLFGQPDSSHPRIYKIDTAHALLLQSLNDTIALGSYIREGISRNGVDSLGLPVNWAPLTRQSFKPGDSIWYQLQIVNQGAQAIESILYFHDLQSAIVLHKEKHLINDSMAAGTLIPKSLKQEKLGLILPNIGNSAQVGLQLSPGVNHIFIQVHFLFEQSNYLPIFRLYPVNNWKDAVMHQRRNIIPFQSMVLGALWILAIYHLLIFIQKREYAFLLYSLYIFSVSPIGWILSGLLQNYTFLEYPIIHHINDKVQVLSLAICIFYFLFMREFVKLNKLLPKFDRFLKIYLIVLASSAILMIVLYSLTFSHNIARFTYLYTIPTLVLGLVYVGALLSTRNPLAIYFSVGSLMLILGVLSNTFIALLKGLEVISQSPNIAVYLVEAGIIIEILIFAMGLGYRQRMKEQEQERIEELDKVKSKFFANISHEFRTPLTVIKGIVPLIKGHKKEKKLIIHNSDNLLRLVNQLLDLSKLDAGNLGVHSIQADIVEYIQYLSESFHSLASEKNINLTFYTEVDTLEMDFDQEKVRQIIYNLLSNALKFTPNGGQVILHLNVIHQFHKDWLNVQVKDSGIGMSDSDLQYIFDRFYQTDSPTIKEKGTGLGLSLTKELIELLGGSIEVTSTPRIGTNFTVLLPIVQEAPKQSTQLFEEDIMLSQPTQERSIPFLSDRPNLLLVEDNRDVVSYIQQLLKASYNIEIAHDGEAGIEKAYKIIPDIIISDVMMPKKNGYEVIQTLKKDTRTSHIPIILLTAKASEKAQIEGLQEGADAYLIKPISNELLIAQLKNLIKQRKVLQQKYTQSPPKSEGKPQATPSQEDIFIQKLRKVIEDRIDDPELGVKDLEEAAFLSNMQTNRKLKALTGKTPSGFIRLVRLQYAMNLLSDQTQTVAEIAYASGFSDPSYFSRVFTEEFGSSPSNFRKM